MMREDLMEKKNQGLETLEVWNRSVDYAVDVCQNVISLFPSEEKWALASQLRRAVQSISANIAEGYGRYNYQETIHFCYIARGSMAETKTHLLLAHRLGYINDVLHEGYQSRLSELGKMLHGYIKHLRKQKSNLGVRELPETDLGYDF
jgi:four helix bundle protein